MKPRIQNVFFYLPIVLTIFTFLPAYSENVTIKQVDPSKLLSLQTVRLFIDRENVATAAPLNLQDVKVSESPDGVNYTEVVVRSITSNTNRDEGISWQLLLDNSGSMWDTMDGKKTDALETTRMANAKKAVREFVSSLSPKDRFSLAAFNTNYSVLMPMSQDASGIETALDAIKRPAREDAYTELYGSLHKALVNFGETGGRKVLIILSDGEHFPPVPAESVVTPEDDIEAANRANISCHVVNFAPESDSKIPRVAEESGGLVFNARNSAELLNIYNSIRSSVLQEYSVTYTAAMLQGEKRFVKISIPFSGESVRYYYTGTVLGANAQPPQLFYILFFLIPLLIWLALLIFRLNRRTTKAGIQVLYGSAGMKTKVFNLNETKTIIGGADSADITIAGNPTLPGNAATILFDKAKGLYTVSADSDLTVNNRSVKSKTLEPGDVINMSGTVIVFDEGEKKKK